MSVKSNDRRINSLVSRIRLLHSVVENPREYVGDECIKAALSSQLAFARYENSSLNIGSCSLNSLKKYAGQLGEGFDGLEKLRIAAYKAIRSVKKTRKVSGSRRSLQEQKAILERKITSLDRDLLHLTLVIKELRLLSLNLTRDVILDKKAYCDTEMRRIDGMLRDWG